LGDSENVWFQVTGNWSKLCLAMGCIRIRLPGAFVHVYDVGRSSTFYNCVLVHDPALFHADEAQRIFEERKLPFSVKIPDLKSFADLAEALRADEYSLLPPWNLMMHEKVIGEGNPDVVVKSVASSQMSEWITASNINELPQISRVARRKMLEEASQTSKAKFLLARLEEKPVGVGMLFMEGHVASIHMMSTLPEFRRRHVATTLVLQALTLRNGDIDLTWLRTRKGGMGEKVYTNLGFSSITNILSYTTTPELEDGIKAKKPST